MFLWTLYTAFTLQSQAMHYRRIVCLILGMWLGGVLIMAWFGARSFQTADSVMNQSNPGFALQTKPLGPATTRAVLRHEIADQNRWLFQCLECVGRWEPAGAAEETRFVRQLGACGKSYAAMPKIVWMNWRCATGSPLATQRT
jgi:hypothetical protein